MSNTIWVTGDCHSDFRKFQTGLFPEQKEMDKTDVVIICGDFGGLWNYQGETSEEKYWLDWLNEKPWTTCFVDGNHECFPRLFALPEEERYGAPVGVARDSVLWLKRGYVYSINGCSIFTFGGASSHDISDGIVNLDGQDKYWKKTARRWEEQGRIFFRINNVSWWKDEIEQDDAVYQRGLDSLAAAGNKVDFIITHCAPTSTQGMMGFTGTDRMTDYLEKIHQDVSFGKWYFGHYHMDRTVLAHEYCIYHRIERIW